MKKRLLSFLILSLLLIAIGARADEITINEEGTFGEFIPIKDNWGDFTNSQFIIPAVDLADMAGGKISSMTFYIFSLSSNWELSEYDVYVGEVQESTFSSPTPYDLSMLTQVYSGKVSYGSNFAMTITFDEPFAYSSGNLLVAFNQKIKSECYGGSWKGVEAAGAAISGHSTSLDNNFTYEVIDFLPMTTFEYTEGNSCKMPKNVTVGEITSNSAKLSWTSDADIWQVSLTDVTTGDSQMFSISGNPTVNLDAVGGHTYTVKIRTVCDDTHMSAWSKDVTFTTFIEACEDEDKCAISYELTAGWEGSAGWSDAALQVVEQETGRVLDTWTLAESQESLTGILQVCPGSTLDFIWISGWFDADLCAFTVYDANGGIIIKHELGSAPTQGVLLSYLVDCNVPIPVTISDSEYATLYYEDKTLELPEDVKAYAAKVDGNNINLTKVSNYIPAGTPVIINGPQGNYDFNVLSIPAQEYVVEDEIDNDLVGTEEDLIITDDEATKYYVLSWMDVNKHKDELGFYFWFGSNDGHSMQLGAHKAYIKRPADAASNKGYVFWLPDAIEGVTMDVHTDSDAIYTLMGIRVTTNNLQKGVYIFNGKKVVIK